jgi:hypothetical protein
LEVLFQKQAGADAQNDKLVATTKAENSGLSWRKSADGASAPVSAQSNVSR